MAQRLACEKSETSRVREALNMRVHGWVKSIMYQAVLAAMRHLFLFKRGAQALAYYHKRIFIRNSIFV
jgi:hypothetical protein